MDWILAFSKPLFGNLRFCAKIGAIAGLISGTLFGLFLWQESQVFPLDQVIYMGIFLGIAAWLFILLAVGIWMHYGVAAIAMRSLLNALLTSVLTVYISNIIQIDAICFLIGLVIGIIIGSLFCYLCSINSKPSKLK